MEFKIWRLVFDINEVLHDCPHCNQRLLLGIMWLKCPCPVGCCGEGYVNLGIAGYFYKSKSDKILRYLPRFGIQFHNKGPEGK